MRIRMGFSQKRPYSGYDQLEFDIPTGKNGDCYDRGVVRVEEIRQSLRIIEQCLKNMPDGLTNPIILCRSSDERADDARYRDAYQSFSERKLGPVIPPGEAFCGIEATKGNNGYYLVSDGNTMAYRVRIRTPSFAHLQMIPLISRGLTVSDLIAILAASIT